MQRKKPGKQSIHNSLKTNKQTYKEIKPKQKPTLGNNLNKMGNDLYNENDKTLKKEIENTRRWTDVLGLWIGRTNIVKTATLPNIIPIKISMTFFTELEKSIKKVTWKHKSTEQSKQS
jgi:hypothetical protein